MQQAGSSGSNSSMEKVEKNEGGSAEVFCSPQDFMAEPMLMQTPSHRPSKRGRPVGLMDAITVSIGNDIDYKTINFPVACDICSCVFGSGSILLTHMRDDHADFVPFECLTCSKPFAKIAQLQKHMITHGVDKQFECPVCQQRFSRQDCVKVHMRIHDKSQCVRCDVCEKTFLTQGALNIHQRIHRGEKPFRCHLCGKCFTQKNHVIMHIMRHSRVNAGQSTKPAVPRMFQCESCPRAFIRLSDFERHMQWTHGQMVPSVKAEPAKIPPPTAASSASAAGAAPVKARDIKAFYQRLNAIGGRNKTVCTIATQTDSSSERVIIPSKYQIPAPPPVDEDPYEDDLFEEEQMDRNYSSDEDDFQTPVPFDGMTTFGTSMTAVDDAFDAVLGKTVTPTAVSSDTVATVAAAGTQSSQEGGESCSIVAAVEVKENTPAASPLPKEDDIVGLVENANIMSNIISNDEASVDKDANSAETEKELLENTPESTTRMEVEAEVDLDADRASPTAEIEDKDVSLINIYNRNAGDVFMSRVVPKIKTNFNMANWRGHGTRRRGRGRGRPSAKIMGLRGAAHLRLMRKSLMHFISERDEEEEAAVLQSEFDSSEAKGASGKRQTKVKQHGKDFLCHSKSCDVCLPGPVKLPSEPEPPVKVAPKVKKEMPLCDYPDKSKKLLQFILSGDAASLEGTDLKLLSEVEQERNDANQFRMHRSMRMDGPVYESGEDEEALEHPDQLDDQQIEEVDFQSVCIPTFSCKLCGREFRFEGKLHRHIEAVHQRKVIYSDDVKPGGKRFKSEQQQSSSEQPSQSTRKVALPVNRELAALRSEWDDDDDDVVDDRSIAPPQPVALPQPRKYSHAKRITLQNNYLYSNRRKQREYSNMSYPQGVKLNFNKFSGNQFTVSKPSPVTVKTETSTTKPAEPASMSLETKCSRLLEKLFKMSLLLKCGHSTDHVSTVLGRVLQHYGVKMIEDYGQGQYEVLKYNLWRLIEWKVTMEQMEEFYTQGKSVEEMMDDIMNSRVPITAHTEPGDKPPAPQAIQAIPITADQLMISQVALDGNVTQLVLAQDISPEMLQGAHIVTLDPTTGQVISQVTADQVIMAGSVSEELTRHIESIDSQIVVSTIPSSSTTTIVSTLPPGSIVGDDGTIHIDSSAIDGELIEMDEDASESPTRDK